ncbi:MAG TPA: hypothetical protein ENI23_09830 [bacterium]|nr:hypothetical protein [bacterium]
MTDETDQPKTVPQILDILGLPEITDPEVGVLVIKQDGSIWITNERANEIFNFGRDMSELTLPDLIPEDSRGYHQYLFDSRIQQGGRLRGSHVVPAIDSKGGVFYVEIEMEKEEYEGETLHVVLVKLD